MRLEYCDWESSPALKPRTMPSRYPAPLLNMSASIAVEPGRDARRCERLARGGWRARSGSWTGVDWVVSWCAGLGAVVLLVSLGRKGTTRR